MFPRILKNAVLRDWLAGDTRDQIAWNHGISTGMVSNIIEEERLVEPPLDIIRELAVNLKKEDLKVKDFTLGVRLQRLSTELDIPLESMEMLLEIVHQNCFKKRLKVSDFVGLIFHHMSILEEYGLELPEFEDYYLQQINLKRRYDQQTKEAKRNTEFELRLYQTTHKKLELFDPLRPIHEKWLEEREKNVKKDIRIEEVERENEEFRNELKKLRNQRQLAKDHEGSELNLI